MTLGESYQYAYQRTEADTAATIAPQRPAFRYEMKGQGNLVLTWPETATASLLLPTGAGKRFVVVNEPETLVVAEGTSNEDAELNMALAPGRYLVKQVLAEKLKVAALTLKDGTHVRTSSLSFSDKPMSSGLVKGYDLIDAVKHPRKLFWFMAAGAVLTGAAWALAGAQTLGLRNTYSAQPRPLTADESASLSGWALGSDIAMGLTAALALTAVFTW